MQIFSDITRSGKSNILAAKPEIPISQLSDAVCNEISKAEPRFVRYSNCIGYCVKPILPGQMNVVNQK